MKFTYTIKDSLTSETIEKGTVHAKNSILFRKVVRFYSQCTKFKNRSIYCEYVINNNAKLHCVLGCE